MVLNPNDKRIRIVSGHFGSGKTEFSINYILELKKHFEKVAAIDLDIINMYFRLREQIDFLEEEGVSNFSSSLPRANAFDLPALDSKIMVSLADETYQTVVDLGGNPKGSLPLGRYREILETKDYDHFFVINRNRPETATVDDTIRFLREIEDYSKTRVTGLINTTNMLKETTVDDVLFGQELVEKVSEKTSLPIKYIVAIKDVAEELKNSDRLDENMKDKIFPINLYFREQWML
uniref:ATP-binding protein n=1 Tax=Anaerococcus mediterraneensis TaxID=1870984 RepID=UPI0009317902|nr:ATP-binding protein [Anaerococcus mediterraneensis]